MNTENGKIFSFGKLIGMKYLICLPCLLLSLALSAQPLRDINYKYLYNPDEPFSFVSRTVRQGENFIVFFNLQLRDTSYKTTDYIIQWESRQTLNEKENISLNPEILDAKSNRVSMSGRLEFALNGAPGILVTKVTHTALKQAWYFYSTFEADYPVNAFITVKEEPKLTPYLNMADNAVVNGLSQPVVSYYNDNFPAALPPFAEAQGRVAKGMKTDSTFFIDQRNETVFSKKGLYLIQRDTNAAEGLTIRAEDDYPRLARIQSLAGPLVYICTKQEYDRLTAAKIEKKNFDRVILSITNDTDRARKLMRSYFRRVELANQFFTSYKEGWKTDRGMIYIVFGLPDEVFKFHDREVWTYNADEYKATFNFSKSSSVFDPDNYVLIRDKKYQQTWYEVIDLWRNARF
jgi:GWxTD domain-containing protein